MDMEAAGDFNFNMESASHFKKYFIPFRAKINTYKLTHAIYFSVTTILGQVIESFLADAQNIEASLKARETTLFRFENYFCDEEKEALRNKAYKRLSLRLQNKIVSAIYCTLTEEFSGEDTKRHIDSLIDWFEDLEAKWDRTHSAEDLVIGLTDLRVVLNSTLEILNLRKVISPIDVMQIHHAIDFIINDVKGYMLVKPCMIWHPKQYTPDV